MLRAVRRIRAQRYRGEMEPYRGTETELAGLGGDNRQVGALHVLLPNLTHQDMNGSRGRAIMLGICHDLLGDSATQRQSCDDICAEMDTGPDT